MVVAMLFVVLAQGQPAESWVDSPFAEVQSQGRLNVVVAADDLQQ